MSADRRLADIVTTLEGVGLNCLVMGGHAARYYGVERNTIDYDLHLAPDMWDKLTDRLTHTGLQPLTEGPSWRPAVFRRFLIGRLADGCEEWLEFWRQNHLLPPFAELYQRREQGPYGGRQLSFLGLPDLIHSKETERETDWQDVALLEEILDSRNLARAVDAESVVVALSLLRSRRGYDRALAAGWLANTPLVADAEARATHPIPRAFLAPHLASASPAPLPSGLMGEILAGPLRKAVPGSGRHLALVEAVRRLYKQAAIAADREDKSRALKP